MTTNIGSKSFEDELGGGTAELHSPFIPADVRQGDPIEATVRHRVGGQTCETRLRVWRLSPMGVELVEPEDGAPLEVGGEVDLTLRLGRQTTDFHGLVVQARHQLHGKSLVGVRWSQPSVSLAFDDNRRVSPRWNCGSEFLPTGVAANPVRFNDFIHFRVRELSRSGMQILTSLRNKFVVPGMRLDAIVSFPAVGQARMDMRIVHARVVSENGKDYLMLGLELLSPSPEALALVGQYILQFGPPTTVEELRASNLFVQSSARAVDFGFVRTADEYRQVLALRKSAYAAAGKVAQDAAVESTSDIFDSRARILIGRYRGEVVASLRLMFHEPDDQFEHEQYVKLPDHFPRKDEIIEVTRVCTHPGYRGSDLLFGLFRQALVTCVQSRRRWVLGSATPKLLPLYTKIGFDLTPVRYRHEALGNEEHIIFLGDVQGAVTGARVGPLLWNAMYADLWSYLDMGEFVEVSPVVNTRLALYRLCRPITQLLARRLAQPRAAKKKK